jgi:hypothetical protein
MHERCMGASWLCAAVAAITFVESGLAQRTMMKSNRR